jgi:hypothetical protein
MHFHVAQTKKLMDKEQSYRRMKFRDVQGETEYAVIAAQD